MRKRGYGEPGLQEVPDEGSETGLSPRSTRLLFREASAYQFLGTARQPSPMAPGYPWAGDSTSRTLGYSLGSRPPSSRSFPFPALGPPSKGPEAYTQVLLTPMIAGPSLGFLAWPSVPQFREDLGTSTSTVLQLDPRRARASWTPCWDPHLPTHLFHR